MQVKGRSTSSPLLAVAVMACGMATGIHRADAAIDHGSRPSIAKPSASHKAGSSRPKRGVASYYADWFDGRKTANGEIFDNDALTAAHRTLPMGTWVRVTDRETGRSVTVRVNDRGPYVAGRTIDLSKRAGEELGITEEGVARVTVEVVSPPYG